MSTTLEAYFYQQEQINKEKEGALITPAILSSVNSGRNESRSKTPLSN
jgi:hypothetical protein